LRDEQPAVNFQQQAAIESLCPAGYSNLFQESGRLLARVGFTR